ncbi:PIN domain-containing protein [Dermatophilaceae bacterium Soc4.6]
MTLVDTSVWIEFLRGTPTGAASFVRDNLGGRIHGSEPVLMELLAGAHTDCLIAAVALRRGIPLAHRDRDDEYIAAATGLAVVDLRE